MSVAARRLRVTPLALGSGWSGGVAAGGSASGSVDSTGPVLPTVEQWQTLLGLLVDDPASLSGYTLLKYSRSGELFRARLVWADRSLEVVCRQSRAAGASGR